MTYFPRYFLFIYLSYLFNRLIEHINIELFISHLYSIMIVFVWMDILGYKPMFWFCSQIVLQGHDLGFKFCVVFTVQISAI